VTALKKIGKKVLIAIGGWNDSAGDKYSRLVNNPAARTRFIKHVMEFMEKHNFDGLDLDWEYPKCWQVKILMSFGTFREQLHDKIFAGQL
jgi:chitinase